jgi:hypothetical protein
MAVDLVARALHRQLPGRADEAMVLATSSTTLETFVPSTTSQHQIRSLINIHVTPLRATVPEEVLPAAHGR